MVDIVKETFDVSFYCPNCSSTDFFNVRKDCMTASVRTKTV